MYTTWTTDPVSPPRRAEFWRSAVCEAFLAMTPRIAPACDFRARLDHLALERLAFNRVRGPAHGVLRTPLDLARAGPEFLFVNLNRRGRARLRQFGREHVAAPGELLLIDSSAPYELNEFDDVDLLSLAVPMQALRADLPRLHDAVAAPVPAGAACRMFTAQLQALCDAAHEVPAASAGSIGEVLVAGLVATLTPPGDAAATHPLARRLDALIARHFDDPAFGPQAAARLAAVSVRSVHACLACGGTSFMARLAEYRLQRARQRLLSPRGARCTVAQVATACGFRSAEHFSRRFHERFGVPPSALRASAASYSAVAMAASPVTNTSE